MVDTRATPRTGGSARVDARNDLPGKEVMSPGAGVKSTEVASGSVKDSCSYRSAGSVGRSFPLLRPEKRETSVKGKNCL